MARIHTYTKDPIPELQDKVIGSDNKVGNTTYNYAIGDIIALAIKEIGLSTANQLVSGGVTWLQDLDYEVSNLTYFLNGEFLTSTGGFLTLDPSDPTLDRIDVIYVDETGTVGIIKGENSATPQKPIVDSTQLELTFVLIEAGATEPANTGLDLVYDENAGSPTEWDGVITEGTGDLDDTEFPYLNTQSVKLANTSTIDSGVTFTSDTLVDFSSFSVLHLYLAIGDALTDADAKITFKIYNGTTETGQFVLYPELFGWDTTALAEYQSVIIPKTFFTGITESQFDKVEIVASKITSKLLIDNINFVEGLETIGVVNTFISLLDTFNSYSGKGQLALRVNAGETGIEAFQLATVATSNDYNDLDNKPVVQAVENEYADIATMLADQVNQTSGNFESVIDASADPTVDSGYAYYEYLGTTVGDLTDYRKLSEEESMDLIPLTLQTTSDNGAVTTNQLELQGGIDTPDVVNNAYFDGQWKRRATGEAQRIAFGGNGEVYIYTALTDLADTVIAWILILETDQTGIVKLTNTTIAELDSADVKALVTKEWVSAQLPTSTQELLNEGADGTSTYAETDELPTKTSDLLNDGADNTSTYAETDELPTKTSDLTNDGADNTSTYVENDEIVEVAKSGLSIRNGNGIEQWKSDEYIEFEGFNFDVPNKRVSSSLNQIIAYVGYPNANDLTAEAGNPNKSWATLNQAMLDTYNQDGVFIQYRLYDFTPDFGTTYEITSQLTTYNSCWEIYSLGKVIIDFTNNTNSTLYSNTNPPSGFYLNRFYIPNGTIRQNKTTSAGTAIGGEDWYIDIASVGHIDYQVSSGTLFTGNGGIYFGHIKKVTLYGNTGYLAGAPSGDVTIGELVMAGTNATKLFTTASSATGTVEIGKITGTGRLLIENNSATNTINYKIGDMLNTNVNYIRYDGLTVEFMNSNIVNDVYIQCNANDTLTITGNIVSCGGRIYSVNVQGVVTFTNFTGDLGTGSELETNLSGKFIARNSVFFVDTIFGNVNGVTASHTPFEFYHSAVYQRTKGNLINGTFTASEIIILEGFNTNANTITVSSPTIQTDTTEFTPHGGYGVDGNTTATTISVAGTYYKVAGVMTANLLRYFTYTADNRLTYTGSRTRKFRIFADPVSMISAGTNVIVALKFAKNGTVIGYPMTRKISTGSDIGAGSLSFDVELTTNDYIELFVTNETNTSSVTIEDLYVSVTEI